MKKTFVLLFIPLMIITSIMSASFCSAFASTLVKETAFRNANDASSGFKLVAGFVEFPPLVTIDENNVCSGDAIDDIFEIFDNTEFAPEIICATPARIYRDFSNLNIHLTINVKTTVVISKDVYYSNHPYKKLIVNLYSWDNDRRETVAAMHRFDYHGARNLLIEDGYDFLDFASAKDAVTVFLRRGTSNLLSYQSPFEYYIEKGSRLRIPDTDQHRFNMTKILEVDSFFVVNKANSNASRIIEIIDQRQLAVK